MKATKILVWILVIIAAVGGGFLLYRVLTNNSKSTPSEKNPDGKLSEKELEKYLLEKRLELKKYFVFNLGELKTMKEKPWKDYDGSNVVNERWCSEKLIDHLSQISAAFRKIIEKKGHKTRGKNLRKEGILFTKSSFGEVPDEGGEWTGSGLDQKIEEKSRYVIFDKYDDEEFLVFFGSTVDDDGKTIWHQKNWITLKTESPYFHVFENKESTLEFLKTDPALQDRV